jgi:hypothetical protein
MKRSRFAGDGDEIIVPLLAPLFNDVVKCEELLEKSDTQFARRTLVRAAFAFNEELIYWFKASVQQGLLADVTNGGLNIEKYLLLGDRKAKLSSTGKIELEDNRISFLTQCAFVLRTAAEQRKVDPEPFFSDNGWNELRNSLKVRHRITHPKKPEDLNITDEDLHSTSEGHRWLFNCLADVTINAPP